MITIRPDFAPTILLTAELQPLPPGLTFREPAMTDQMRESLAKLREGADKPPQVASPSGQSSEELRAEMDRMKAKFSKEALEARLAGAERGLAQAEASRAQSRPELEARRRQMATAPVVPEVVVTGDEAKQAMKWGEAYAKDAERRTGHPQFFPPSGNMTYGFPHGDFMYYVHGDGTITRRRNGFPISEENRADMLRLYDKSIQFHDNMVARFTRERDVLKAALRDGTPFDQVNLVA